jgi:hypothetical protein
MSARNEMVNYSGSANSGLLLEKRGYEAVEEEKD